MRERRAVMSRLAVGAEIFDLADRMQVQGDLPGILHALNEAGELLKRGPSLYACPAARAHEV